MNAYRTVAAPAPFPLRHALAHRDITVTIIMYVYVVTYGSRHQYLIAVFCYSRTCHVPFSFHLQDNGFLQFYILLAILITLVSNLLLTTSVLKLFYHMIKMLFLFVNNCIFNQWTYVFLSIY